MQFIKSNKIKKNIAQHLKPADLIFTASKRNPRHINHVMMYLGNGNLIESTGAHGKVRIISMQQRSGKTISQLAYGKQSGKFYYYFGTYFRKVPKKVD
jgi:cell wall-associated NlpC family hydrolase